MPRLRLKSTLRYAHRGIDIVEYAAGVHDVTDPAMIRCAIEDHGAELVDDAQPADPPPAAPTADDPPQDDPPQDDPPAPPAPPAKKATKRTRRKRSS